MNEKKREYYHHGMMYRCIDGKTKEELEKMREILKMNYLMLFDNSGILISDRAKKLERLYYLIDNRIGENLKLWR